MSLWSVIAVFFGGGLGSLLRFGISRTVIQFGYQGRFPLSTLLANLIACVLLAALVFLALKDRSMNESWKLFWIVGVCGGFSTFSTFSYENWILYRDGHLLILGLNLLLSIVLGIAIFVFAHRFLSVAA